MAVRHDPPARPKSDAPTTRKSDLKTLEPRGRKSTNRTRGWKYVLLGLPPAGGIIAGLVGNLATNGLEVPGKWKPALWVCIGLLTLTLSALAGKALTERRPSSGGRLFIGTLPPRPDGFQDRTLHFASVRSLSRSVAVQAKHITDPGAVTVVRGASGIGKTQIAAEHARQLWNSREIDVLIWIQATSRNAIMSTYAQASPAEIKKGDEPIAAERFLGWLATTELRWLVVLDDLRNPSDLNDLWPPRNPQGRTVVTTPRLDASLCTDGRQMVNLGLFTPSEAKSFLEQRFSEHPERASGSVKLAEALGFLPVALAQAAAYITDRSLNCQSYLERFTDRKTTLKDIFPDKNDLPDHYPNPLAVTWRLTLDLADNLEPQGLVRALFYVMAVMDSNGIPAAAFTSEPLRDHLRASLQRDVNAEQITDALSTLHRFSLLTYAPDTPHHTVRVHTLTQRATRETLDDSRLRATAGVVADALVAIWPTPERDTILGAVLRSNADALIESTGTCLLKPDLHPIVVRAGESLGSTGQFADAENYFDKFSKLAAAHLGQMKVETLELRGNALHWLGQSGRPTEAAAGFSELIRDLSLISPTPHEAILSARHNLAHWRGMAGDASGAAKEFEAIVRDLTKEFGAEDRQVLAARSNQLLWRRKSGDSHGALDGYIVLVNDLIRLRGPRDPLTLRTQVNFAHCRGITGDTRGAVDALQNLLPTLLAELPPDDLLILTARSHLARWHGESGDAVAACDAYEKLTEPYRRVMGPDSPKTLDVWRSLAHWRMLADDPKGARDAFEYLLSQQTRVLGPHHPETNETRRLLQSLRRTGSRAIE